MPDWHRELTTWTRNSQTKSVAVAKQNDFSGSCRPAVGFLCSRGPTFVQMYRLSFRLMQNDVIYWTTTTTKMIAKEGCKVIDQGVVHFFAGGGELGRAFASGRNPSLSTLSPKSAMQENTCILSGLSTSFLWSTMLFYDNEESFLLSPAMRGKSVFCSGLSNWYTQRKERLFRQIMR